MAENVKYPQDEEKNEYRYIDFAWLDEIAMGLTAGAKKHPGETWREIPAREHVARAIRHLSMHQTGDSSEPHLGEMTRAAHEAGLSYGQYMAQKRMAKGEEV